MTSQKWSSFATLRIVLTPLLCKSNIVYNFFCPGCSADYIGKIERTFYERSVDLIYDRSDKYSSIVNQHLNECAGSAHIMKVIRINTSLFNNNFHDEILTIKSSRINLVQNNAHVIRRRFFC